MKQLTSSHFPVEEQDIFNDSRKKYCCYIRGKFIRTSQSDHELIPSGSCYTVPSILDQYTIIMRMIAANELLSFLSTNNHMTS